MASTKVIMQLSSGGEESHENPRNKPYQSLDLNLGIHEYKAGVLTTQNDHCD
jgi:hypothetical protein